MKLRVYQTIYGKFGKITVILLILLTSLRFYFRPKCQIFKIHNPKKYKCFFYEHVEFEGKKFVKLSSAADAAHKNLVSSIVPITMLANIARANVFQ